MRVTFNTTYRNATDAIADAAQEMATRQQQVATGRRIQVPSDDPAAASFAVSERTELAVTESYRQATDTVSSKLTILDSVLSSLVDETTAAKVAVQSARGSIGDAQREAAADQVLAVRDSILAAINTQFRGAYLFAGNDSTTMPYTKAGSVVSDYQGQPATVRVDIDRQTAVQIALSADDLLRGGDAEDLFASLEKLAVAIRSGDTDGMEAGAAAIDRSFNRLNQALGRVGTDMALVETYQRQLDTRKTAGQARIAALEDVDLAEAISGMTQADAAYRAALSAVGTQSRLSLLDYLK